MSSSLAVYDEKTEVSLPLAKYISPAYSAQGHRHKRKLNITPKRWRRFFTSSRVLRPLRAILEDGIRHGLEFAADLGVPSSAQAVGAA